MFADCTLPCRFSKNFGVGISLPKRFFQSVKCPEQNTVEIFQIGPTVSPVGVRQINVAQTPLMKEKKIEKE